MRQRQTKFTLAKQVRGFLLIVLPDQIGPLPDTDRSWNTMAIDLLWQSVPWRSQHQDLMTN